MNNIEIKSGNSTIKAEYIVGTPTRRYQRIGLANPKTTQCLIWQDGMVVASGAVVKCNKDADNDRTARLRATQKALRNTSVVIDKEVRTQLFNSLIEEPQA